MMKEIRWNEEKNAWLKANRGVSFEQVLQRIVDWDVLDDVEHWNRGKYPNQNVLMVEIGSYGYYVPYVETETEIFLKTVIPCRKTTKKYLGS